MELYLWLICKWDICYVIGCNIVNGVPRLYHIHYLSKLLRTVGWRVYVWCCRRHILEWRHDNALSFLHRTVSNIVSIRTVSSNQRTRESFSETLHLRWTFQLRTIRHNTPMTTMCVRLVLGSSTVTKLLHIIAILLMKSVNHLTRNKAYFHIGDYYA